MNPCSTNQGGTAHWALLCGVIVESVNKKRNKKRITRIPVVEEGYLTGFVDNEKESAIESYSVQFMDTSDYGESEDDCKMCKKSVDPIYYRRDEFLHYEKDYNKTFKAYCSDADDEGNDDDDSKKGGDNFNGNNDGDNKKKRINNGRKSDKKIYNNNKVRQCVNHGNPGRRSSEIGSKLNLERDADRVWVIARHGAKGNRYIVWSLRELANSNRQLRLPSEKIMHNVVPKSVLKSKSLNFGPMIRKYDDSSQFICHRRDRQISKKIVSNMVLPTDVHDSKSVIHCMEINYEMYHPDLKYEHELSVDAWRAATAVPTKVPYADFMPPLRERQRTMVPRNKTMPAKKMLKPRYTQPELVTRQKPYYNKAERVTLKKSTESVKNRIRKIIPDGSMEMQVTPEGSMMVELSPPRNLTSKTASEEKIFKESFNFMEEQKLSYEEGPYMLPEGIRLDRCLARRFVVFEPVQSPTYTYINRTLQVS